MRIDLLIFYFILFLIYLLKVQKLIKYTWIV